MPGHINKFTSGLQTVINKLSTVWKNPTPNQRLVEQALVSMLLTACVGALTATYQYYAHNSVDMGTMLNFMFVAFFTLFSKALYDYVPGHAQQLIQAMEEELAQLREEQKVTAPTLARVEVSAVEHPEK